MIIALTQIFWQVRSERNKAREEVRILRGRLEVSQRENSALKREKNDMEAQMSHLSKTYHMVCPRKDPSLEQQEESRSQVREREDCVLSLCVLHLDNFQMALVEVILDFKHDFAVLAID